MKDKKIINIGLKKESLKTMCGELSLLLASTYDLYYQTQACHWNVVSPQFHMYHQLFEEQYNALSEAVDDIAERIRALGQFPAMDLKKLLSGSFLSPLPQSTEGPKMVAHLLKAHEKMIAELRKMEEKADDVDDEGTADFFIERLRAHEKTAWMLRSGL